VLAAVLALGCSVAYGVSNYLAPLQGRRHSLATVLVVSQLAALLATIALLAAMPAAPPSAGALGFAVLAGLGNLVGLAAFYRAAQLGPISVVAPIGATAAVVPVAVGLIGGEAPGALRLTGIVAAVTGAALAARRSVAAPAPAGERPGLCAAWAAGAAVAFGSFLTALPPAAEEGLPWALFVARVVLVCALLAGVAVLGGVVTARRSDLAPLATPGLLLVLGTVLYALAAERGLLSVVGVLGSLFPVVTVGLAVVLLGERMSRVQATGVTLALIGVVLLAT